METKVHQECKNIFMKLFRSKDGNSSACDIWNIMVSDATKEDNCIGENFNQLLISIRDNWFKNRGVTGFSIDFYHTTYLIWLYLVVSRVYEIFETLNPKQNNIFIEKKKRSLITFNEINLWAKFIKHPKEFIFSHWPEYCCDGEVPFKRGEKVVTINTMYLKDHYTSDKSDRPVSLKNNVNVTVQYPKVSKITQGFVDDFLTFRDFICKNEMLVEELKKCSNVSIADS